jgi:hypothetical protein
MYLLLKASQPKSKPINGEISKGTSFKVKNVTLITTLS